MDAPFPPAFSGVVPSLTQSADLGPPRSECGVGCLMPWCGRLYVLNYVSHRRRTGTGTGLRVIGEDFRMERHPAAVDGTFANRFVHHPTNTMIIGPHLVDTEHRVRTVPELTDIRLCGTAVHLKEPERLVYMLGMEGELFELDVRTLAVQRLFDLTEVLNTPGEGKCHFKDCITGGGRLVVVNNDYSEPDFLGRQSEGTLAEFDGEAWRVVDRRPYVGLGGLGPYGRTIFASGWDRASALLTVFTAADGQWRTYRLPKASHCFEHKWQTEWPRIRSVEHERLLLDHHGMFYELSPWAFGNRVWGVRPISTHLWVHGDFCTWKGLLVIGADNASHDSGGNVTTAEPQSGLWFGRTDDLWKLGPPKGWGGPWWKSPVKEDAPSDPYLLTGFGSKCLHLFHEGETAVAFDLEVDALGDGAWKRWKRYQVAPGEAVVECFPPGFSAHWLRLVPRGETVATAQLHYT
ncbi:MAG: hypothetical protein EA425_16965 [Puniceicoccaceae bacterium]|nr:MAG: hypothetical protein EA425_16965 [Puniceicoccaceae bacterium]